MRVEETSPDQAARLAEELARLLDSVQIERLSFDGLAGLVPDRYASHWQLTLRFLQVLTRHWPDILADEQALDPADRRNRLIAAQADLWRHDPPTDPVVAAGTTGTMPATADLLGVVARLPQGCVVLPGLDPYLADDAWEALDGPYPEGGHSEAGHPQHAMKQLLAKLGVARRDVLAWDDGRAAGAQAPACCRAPWSRRRPPPAGAPHRYRRTR